MLNKITLIGRLGRDPELKMTTGGTPVSSFSVATTETWKDQSGEKKTDTQWHNLVLWGKNAENAEKLMKKGQLHYFEGTLKYEKDKDYENNKKTYAKIHVTSFKLLPQGNGQGGHTPDDSNLPPGYTGGRPGDEPHYDDHMPSASSSSGNYDDDIPF